MTQVLLNSVTPTTEHFNQSRHLINSAPIMLAFHTKKAFKSLETVEMSVSVLCFSFKHLAELCAVCPVHEPASCTSHLSLLLHSDSFNSHFTLPSAAVFESRL